MNNKKIAILGSGLAGKSLLPKINIGVDFARPDSDDTGLIHAIKVCNGEDVQIINLHSSGDISHIIEVLQQQYDDVTVLSECKDTGIAEATQIAPIELPPQITYFKAPLTRRERRKLARKK